MPTVNEIIIEFAKAVEHADDGPNERVIAKDGSPCTPSMARYTNAMMDLMAIDKDIPPPLEHFRSAQSDRGCMHCWLSSNHHRCHSECLLKIARWFKARDNLVAYAKSLS